ncbi:MAG TPA: 3-dehydroquinate synthase [Methylomirabilota bacterium]|jgi:3-dehydroquinate synthase|nr:3-dehydroquinate synthase [Methylomirabilota bacterium]
MIVPVKLADRSYTIVVECGALATVGDRLRDLGVGSRVVIVSDATVLRLYGDLVRGGVGRAGFTTSVIEVPQGEAAKTLAVAERCWNALLDAGLDRGSTVVALGGGTVGDVAGFVAATYMRGVNLVHVPTTVLAQLDSSIGGKTAINHPRAKNLIGSFHQPRLVIVDPAVVQTMEDRAFRSGLAEMAKHGVVLDAEYFGELEQNAGRLLARDLTALERAIGGSCRLKAWVVERDEKEAELRAVLNYGHTIGHALEAATCYATLTHGEAVALGMVAEARIAERRGLAAAETTRRQEALLKALRLPVRMSGIDPEAVLVAIGHDKKSRDGRVPFVLAPTIGTFRLVHDVTADDVRAALADLAA